MLKLRGGIIGLGRIGAGFDDNVTKSVNTHAGAHHKSKNVELISLCDIDSKKLKKYGKKYQIKNLYTKYTELLKKEQLDCISICTHADTHLDIIECAAKNGIKRIFVEKPIETSLKNAKKILSICKKYDILLSVDHQRRFNPFYHSIKNDLKKLGKIQLVRLLYGGGITNTGTHIADIIRFFFGEIVSCKSDFGIPNLQNPNDPNLNAELILKNNLHVFLHSLNTSHYGLLEMDIIGSLGRLNIDLAVDKCIYKKISQNSGLVYKKLVTSIFPIKQFSKTSIQLGIENLLTSKNKSELKSSGIDGYKSLEIILALMMSSQQHETITLPLQINNYKIESK